MRRFPALILALAVCQAAISTPQAAAAGREQIEAMVVAQARDLGISIPLALAVAHAESNFSPGAVSSKGASPTAVAGMICMTPLDTALIPTRFGTPS